MNVIVWRAGTTPILKRTLREFGLKFWHPTNSESRSESCSENRVSQKLGRKCHSENCSENTPGVFTPRAVFFKIGVVPRLLRLECFVKHLL